MGEVTHYTIGRVQRGPCRKLPVAATMHGFVIRYTLLEEGRKASNICWRCLSLLRDYRDMSGKSLEIVAVENADLSDEAYWRSTVVYETYDVGPALICDECFSATRSTRGVSFAANLN